MRYRVREVDGDEEAAEILALHDAAFGSDAPPPEASKGWWWFAEALENGKWTPVGFAQLKRSANFLNVGYLARAGVLPWHRGHRLQVRLIRAREAYAKKLGYVALVSDTTNNPGSARSLVRAGFLPFTPKRKWSLACATYWIKWLNHGRDTRDNLQPKPHAKGVHRKSAKKG